VEEVVLVEFVLVFEGVVVLLVVGLEEAVVVI
jgi:hypothetical protein